MTRLIVRQNKYNKLNIVSDYTVFESLQWCYTKFNQGFVVGGLGTGKIT